VYEEAPPLATLGTPDGWLSPVGRLRQALESASDRLIEGRDAFGEAVASAQDMEQDALVSADAQDGGQA